MVISSNSERGRKRGWGGEGSGEADGATRSSWRFLGGRRHGPRALARSMYSSVTSSRRGPGGIASEGHWLSSSLKGSLVGSTGGGGGGGGGWGGRGGGGAGIPVFRKSKVTARGSCALGKMGACGWPGRSRRSLPRVGPGGGRTKGPSKDSIDGGDRRGRPGFLLMGVGQGARVAGSRGGSWGGGRGWALRTGTGNASGKGRGRGSGRGRPVSKSTGEARGPARSSRRPVGRGQTGRSKGPLGSGKVGVKLKSRPGVRGRPPLLKPGDGDGYENGLPGTCGELSDRPLLPPDSGGSPPGVAGTVSVLCDLARLPQRPGVRGGWSSGGGSRGTGGLGSSGVSGSGGGLGGRSSRGGGNGGCRGKGSIGGGSGSTSRSDSVER